MYPTLHFADQVLRPAQIEDTVSRVIAGLSALGLREGDAVACMLRNSPAYVALLIACRQAGFILVSINWHFKAEEAGWILGDSDARALVIDADLVAQIATGIPAGLPVIRVPAGGDGPATSTTAASTTDPSTAPDWSTLGQGLPKIDVQGRRPRFPMAYTSGTTGKPKGVRRLPPPPERMAEIERDARAVSELIFGVTTDSRVLLSAPIYHSAPMSYLGHACQVGAVVVLEAGFDAARTLELIQRHRITHAYLVPTMYQRLLRLPEAERAGADLSSIRQVTSTGSPCPADLKQRMIDWWGPVITETYASSETGYITFIDAPTWLARPGSAGRPVGRAELRILDEQGVELPPGEVGLIYARQPAYPEFTYQNNDTAREKIGQAGMVTLGDVGRLDAEGYLYVSDRRSDMVISGGVNIYPAEIEAALGTCPGVADCAVFGIPDEEFGEALAAHIEPLPGVRLEESTVLTHLRERLANFKLPRVIRFEDRLPREDTGKIFKKRLREAYWRDRSRSI